MIKTAAFSPCRRWRYTLHRIWDESLPYVQFIGLNPSTADEEKDDRTVAKCQRYARAWGYGGIVMTNIFGWRDTDPKEMKKQPDPEGAGNMAAIIGTAEKAGIVVAAWGTHGTHFDNHGRFVRFLLERKVPEKLHVLKLTKDGHPAHPLYLRSDLKPILWTDAILGAV